MNPYTQPATEAEIARMKEFQAKGMVPFLGVWTPDEFNSNPPQPAESGPDYSNGGIEIDWLILNRDFS